MAEGKTSMFGKTYNTIGSTDSNFIIKTKGDLKVQWGNKYIDVIKNGKIASESTKILKKVDSLEGITSDGIYLVGDTVWAIIDGVKVLLSSNLEDIFVSFLTEQKDVTSDLKNLALTNIGFYYDTLEDAKSANIKAGLVYVKGDSKLYIIKDGIFSVYAINQQLSSEETEEPSFEKLYISEYSLFVDGEAYATYLNNLIIIHKPIILEEALYSKGATSTFGYRLYMKDGESYLEIDHIILRKDTMLITHGDLLTMIENESLVPKKYYIIEDFLNPWEVSWPTEPLHYKDYYIEYNGEKKLGGIRNVMHLIVLAANYNVLEEYAWSLENPEWIIKYDVNYLGPEHKISDENILYGFRNNSDEKLVYLPCKGQITYLKDEFGNEGNFNFRLFRFKRDGVWRYCIDDTTDPNDLLGNFCKKAKGNNFILESIDSYVLVFTFESVINSTNDIIGYNIIPVEDDVLLTIGHNLIVLSEESNNNTFNLPKTEELRVHEIKGLLENNKFINIEKTIRCYADIKNNTFENLKKSLDILIPCEGNTLIGFEEDVIIQGVKFDNNYLSKFKYYINNYNIFEGNKIYQCDGYITNNGTISNNIILYCKGNITNQGNIIDNEILQLAIELSVDSGDFRENLCLNIETLRSLGSFVGNTLDNVINLYNQSVFSENIITDINDLNNQGNMNNNSIKNITYLFNQSEFTNNTISDIKNLSNQGTITNNTITYIENLDNSGTFSENIIESIIGYLHNNNNITNNNINTIDTLSISANMSDNTITKIVNSHINGNFIENIFNIITDSTFNSTCLLNDSKKTFSNSQVNDFINNIIYLNINSLIPNGSITNCIFKYDILNFYPNNLINCLLEFISNLSLDRDAVHTAFHGSIGNPDRQLTEHEWDLLGDGGKKTDAYPNMRVVCVPEIIKKGMILMWYGKEEIPKGWALCDGKNGTPDLVGSFIKGDSSTADRPTVPEGVDEETNEYTLKTEHLPKHSHPHKAHQHYFEGSGSTTITDDYASYNSSYSVTEGEGGSATSGENWSAPSESETITINISGNTSSVTSEEDGWQYNDPPTPIKLEPKHFKIIFIMKIDENPE